MEELKILASLKFRSDWWVLLLPCALMAIDFSTGVMHAWITGHIKSFKMRQGLGKKAGEIALLIASELVTLGLMIPPYIVTGMSLYIILMEAISIFENLDKLGVPIPKFIKTAFGTANEVLQNGDISDKDKKKLKDDIIGKEV